jgi:dolichol-phosphate mannosyltransferase
MTDLAIVIPTYNEKDNVRELTSRLEKVLVGVQWEAIFVDDDSPDGTHQVVFHLARSKPNIRCVHRIGRRGLSSAAVEGMLATSAPYIAVMDADLQHDEALLPQMLNKLSTGTEDIVIASRYCAGGSTGEWDSSRATMSRFATMLSRLIVTADLTDPMSGFFMIRREALHRAVRGLSKEGYKILLDLFASSPTQMTFAELPYTFRERAAGESKLDSAVMWEYLLLIIDKLFGHIVPGRFVMFSMVGLTGVFVHFLCLWTAFQVAGVAFGAAQLAATFVAMTSNYALNNLLTYRDRRRRGVRFLTGLLSFYLICGIGVVANVGVANFVFTRDYSWWLAGGAGVLVGTVWNYTASGIFTWGRR